MKTFEILRYLSVFIGLLVACYYWKNKYRYFFTILAVNDIVSLLLWVLFSFSGQIFWIPFTYLLIFTIWEIPSKQKYLFVLLGLFPILLINYYSTNLFQQYFVIVSHIIILFLFIRKFIFIIFDKGIVNLFYIFIIIYEVVIILNFIAILSKIQVGINVYYVGMIIQIIVRMVLIYVRNGKSISLTNEI